MVNARLRGIEQLMTQRTRELQFKYQAPIAYSLLLAYIDCYAVTSGQILERKTLAVCGLLDIAYTTLCGESPRGQQRFAARHLRRKYVIIRSGPFLK